MNKDYTIGIYIRLSMADEDTGYTKDESDSIGNQRMLIKHFLDEHPELSKYPRLEFADDGYTGTNFQRPHFTEMMEKVRAGEINLICVKDFSRFSRDYIETGNYLECVFPFLGVRFISINDGYDSEDYKGTTGGLEVVMRSIIYAAYSKDLSVKTTTAKIQMMKQGKYVRGYAPYGYMMHPTQRNKLALDPESAAVVRRVFDEALAGRNTSEIAEGLNDDKVPTPGQYFRSKYPGNKRFSRMSDKISWNVSMVYKLLVSFVYTGATVGHKRKSVGVGSRKTVAQDRENWIVVEGMHEAIVSKLTFELAHAFINVIYVHSDNRVEIEWKFKDFIVDIAKAHHKSVAQIILRWHIQLGNIPIVNTGKVEHLKENFSVFDFSISEEEMRQITAININSRLRYDPDNCDFSKL